MPSSAPSPAGDLRSEPQCAVATLAGLRDAAAARGALAWQITGPPDALHSLYTVSQRTQRRVRAGIGSSARSRRRGADPAWRTPWPPDKLCSLFTASHAPDVPRSWLAFRCKDVNSREMAGASNKRPRQACGGQVRITVLAFPSIPKRCSHPRPRSWCGIDPGNLEADCWRVETSLRAGGLVEAALKSAAHAGRPPPG
jgi:hypothetical protein